MPQFECCYKHKTCRQQLPTIHLHLLLMNCVLKYCLLFCLPKKQPQNDPSLISPWIVPFFYDLYYLIILYRHFYFKKYSLFSASESFDSTYPTNVVVTSEGLCTYIPPGMFKSSCPIDITWFPFDDQSCEMKFGSWTYNGFKVKKTLFYWILPGFVRGKQIFKSNFHISVYT